MVDSNGTRDARMRNPPVETVSLANLQSPLLATIPPLPLIAVTSILSLLAIEMPGIQLGRTMIRGCKSKFGQDIKLGSPK